MFGLWRVGLGNAWREVLRGVAVAGLTAAALFLLPPFSASAQSPFFAGDGREGGRFRSEISTFFTPSETAYAEVGWTWTPDWNFEADGWRFRLASAAGIFRDRNLSQLALFIPTYFYEISAGYRQRFGNWTTTSSIGLLGVEEAGFQPFSRFGVRLTEQIVWSDSADYYAGLFLRYESVRDAFVAVANLGFLTPLAFKIGPELGFNLSTAGTGYRYGLAITGIAFFGAELGLSAGIGQRERGRPDAYVTAYFYRLF